MSSRKKIADKKPKNTFIDLFAGCGGLSLGLMNSGWQGLFAVEKNEDAFSTLDKNLCNDHPNKFDWPSWLPQQATTTKGLLDNHKPQLRKLRDAVDLIAGGPPCQGFSFAGKRDADDPRNKLNEEYIEVVNVVRPKFLLFENVRGFTKGFEGSQSKPHSAIVKEKLEGLRWGGYLVFCSVINASLFGVPQPRSRFILLAVRKDHIKAIGKDFDPFAKLEEFCVNFKGARNLNTNHTSVSEAISDLEIAQQKTTESLNHPGFKKIDYDQPKEMTPFQTLMRMGLPSDQTPNSLRVARHRPATQERFQDILKTCPKGKSLSKELRAKYGMKKQCFTPLDPNQLSKTITTLPDDLLHYSEARILTVRENARLQSFPDWFQFKGKYTTGGDRRKLECPRYTQVGNAVPPLMAEALGELLLGIGNDYD